MIRAATPKGVLDTVGWLILSLLIGALAGRIAKYFEAPMELRVTGVRCPDRYSAWRSGTSAAAPEATATRASGFYV